MEFEYWWLLGLPIFFGLGWLAARVDIKHLVKDSRALPASYFKGLNFLLNEQPDKAIEAFIEVVKVDPETIELHFALGSLFRRRGEFERAVRVHQHLMQRADLSAADQDRARFALAQDYLKAGLFDRAEQAYQALEGSRFDTDARLALLQLHERSRDWRAAADDAARLERAGTASFASRIAHHWCELAHEAQERGDSAEADRALLRAREVAPGSPRPWAQAGQHQARAGQHAQALASWNALRQAHPAVFTLVAQDYAHSALAAGQTGDALAALQHLYAQQPSLDLLRAIDTLEANPAQARQRHAAHLAQQPGLSAAAAVLHDMQDSDTHAGVIAAIEQAAKPLQRYRCAACAFEAQRYFWQCPGCMSWDSYPPLRVEET